jgi:hypothetical protein
MFKILMERIEKPKGVSLRQPVVSRGWAGAFMAVSGCSASGKLATKNRLKTQQICENLIAFFENIRKMALSCFFEYCNG